MKAQKPGRSTPVRAKKTVRRAKGQFPAAPAARPEIETSLQAFFEALDDLVFVFEPTGRILFTNPAAQKQLGYTPAELAGMSALDLHPPELRPEAAKYLASLHANKIIVCPLPLQARDGTRIPVETKIMQGEWHGQKALLGISHDVTQRKQAEETLQHERNLFRTVLDNLPSIIFIKDKEGRYVLSNRAHQGVLGATEEALLGKTAFDFHPNDLARQYQEDEKQIMRSGEPIPPKEERALNHGLGGYRWHLTSRIPFKDETGQVAGIVGISHDITNRKSAEEVLRESQALYHSFIDQLPAAVFRKDREGRYVMVNPRFCQLKGVKAEEFLGRTAMEVAAHQTARQGKEGQATKYAGLGDEVHEQIMRAGKSIETEEEYTGADGGRQFFHVLRMPVYGPDRTVIGTQGILFDVTARKQAEEALRQGGLRLEKINRCLLELGSNHDANINRLTALCGELLGATCAVYNRLQGDLLCALGQWQTPAGFKSEDAPAGHLCFDVIRNSRDEVVVVTNLPQSPYAKSDPNVRAYGLQTYMGCAVKCEGQAIGSLCVAYNTDYRPTDDDRRILGIIASAIGNVDTRKQAEAELNRLMTAIEQTPESVVITDTEGRILYVNPVFEKVTGYARAEVIGQNPRLLKSNRQESGFYRDLWTKISAGEVWRGRFVNKKKDGALFTEDAVIAPVRDGKGAVTNYIAIKRDISHELELEGQYRQTQKIDSIGRLAGGVAHDFNNILAVICGHTDLALAQLSPDAPLRSNLECIQESAERAANLTRQLLAFARRQVIEPRRINLNQLIVNLNKMLHRLIGEDIKLVTQTVSDLGQVRADPGQIEQVLLNLVVNARDAMPDGGTLTIRTANATINEDYARRHLATPGKYAMVSVTDTGVGMTEEVKQHIFEPFFTTKEQGKGTGLGLATCFGIIQQSNGHIESESQLGRGTEFRFYLPCVEGPEESVSIRGTLASLPQGTETILLAEDENSLRRLMAKVLRNQGYTVLEASDGHHALTLAQANGAKIQLLITDVIMPGLSGKTLAEWLGQVNPAVRVLFISGYINNNAVRDAMSKAGTFFLQKPFNPLDLTKKVREAIDTLQPGNGR